jgi:hypothetical protein
MIIGAILAIIEGIAIVLKCILDFPPEVTKIYAIDFAFTIFATIIGVVMIAVGIGTLCEKYKKRNMAKKGR